jgi:DNA-binding response OmpR family regulator
MDTAEAPWVLLVEDDETLAGLLIDHLRRRGILARNSSTIAETLAVLAAGDRPALIVLDINLPDGAGWQVARDPRYVQAGSPPIVVASAVGVRPAQLRAAGIAGYLPKPFPLTTFMDVVERHLRPAAVPADTEERP